MVEIFFKEECFKIQGAVFEVYREMGCGFLEAVYQECLEKELHRRGIPFAAQRELKISYKGEPLRQTYKPDFLCFDAIIIELKALSVTTGEHKAQVINYLKATGLTSAFWSTSAAIQKQQWKGLSYEVYEEHENTKYFLFLFSCLSCFSWTLLYHLLFVFFVAKSSLSFRE